MKKLFIILFPQKEYVAGYFSNDDILLFNKCIQKRYLDNGYEFCVATFHKSDLGIISLTPNMIVDADITFEQSSPLTCAEWRYADFNVLAKKIPLDKFSKIVLAGFHCYDCVEKFANEIYAINSNIIIDTDLTEMFRNSYLYEKSFKLENFNPDLKLKRILDRNICNPLFTFEKVKEKYQNPIWGISSKIMNQIEQIENKRNKDIFETIEKSL